eukprot:scaffold37902_cov34-Prasinocladus_malaysianus.AAC.2
MYAYGYYRDGLYELVCSRQHAIIMYAYNGTTNGDSIKYDATAHTTICLILVQSLLSTYRADVRPKAIRVSEVAWLNTTTILMCGSAN